MDTLSTTLLEATTGFYTFLLRDEDGDGIDVSVLDTMTLTYVDASTGTVLNARDAQNVKNINDVTIITDPGPPLVTTVTWTLQPADTVVVDPMQALELHTAIFRWSWDGGSRHGAQPMQFGIENLVDTP
jgi:hypothetical protein